MRRPSCARASTRCWPRCCASLIGLLVGLVVLFIINPEHAWDQGFMRIIQGGFYDFPTASAARWSMARRSS